MADHFQNFNKRPHLTSDQRLPKSYKEVEKVLQAVKACQGSIKTVMYNSRLRGSVFNKVYALAVNVLKNRNLLDKIIEETQLLEKENFRKEMAGIMIHELILGKGLPGKSKPVLTMKKYEDVIFKAYRSVKDDITSLTELHSLPKYVRVNTLKTSETNVLKDLKEWNYHQISYENSATFAEFLDLVSSLETGCFLIDYHFKDLFVFASSENLSCWPLYQKGHVFIQDKSSYLPVHILDPKPGSTILDACAAPGMKTIHMAAQMQNTGKIFAFERDEQRFEILKNMLKSADVQICSSCCEDFYLVNKDNPEYNSVEYILVDPSCSGSGMVNRMDEVTDTEESKNKLRLQKLAGFQILLLKHALSFPSVKRVVYSTCSITEEENEFVVHEVLNHFRHSFKLVPVMPHWPIRGFDHFEFGSLCLRAFSERSMTNGFFVAMFERLDFEEQQQLYEKSFGDLKSLRKSKSRKRKSNPEYQGDNEYSQEQNYADSEIKNEDSYTENTSDYNNFSKKSRKKKYKAETQGDNEYSQEQNYANSEIIENTFSEHPSDYDFSKKSKKKKSKAESQEYNEYSQEQNYPDSEIKDENTYSENTSDCNNFSKTKSKKKKSKTESQEDNEYSQEQNYADSVIKNENTYSENTSDYNNFSKTKSRKKKSKAEFQAESPYFESSTYVQEVYATKENSKSFSYLTENQDTVESTHDQSHDVKYKTKKNHKKKNDHETSSIEDMTKIYSDPYVAESVLVNVGVKKKNKHYSDHLKAENSDEFGEIKIKNKKSKKVKLEDSELQTLVLEEVRQTDAECKIRHKKSKKSISLSNEESSEQDFEISIETVPEVLKKKHKKKCKDKRHKGE